MFDFENIEKVKTKALSTASALHIMWKSEQVSADTMKKQWEDFLSYATGTIKFWSLRQGVRRWNFEEKTKTKQTNKKQKKKQKKIFLLCF